MKIQLSQLDEAYRWLCQQRKHVTLNADIWHSQDVLVTELIANRLRALLPLSSPKVMVERQLARRIPELSTARDTLFKQVHEQHDLRA